MPRLNRPRRLDPRQLRRRRLTWWLASSMVGVAVLAGPFWLWHSGWMPDRLDRLTDAMALGAAKHGFRVGAVRVSGRVETSQADILAAAAVRVDDPTFAIDTTSIKARIEALPWVARATVSRHLPDTLRIHLTERTPIALWQRNGKLSLIDQTGFVIAAVGGASDVPERYALLPVIVGESAPEAAQELFALLATQPEIALHVEDAVRVGGRRWTLRLDSGIDVELPESAPATALARLAALDRDERILARDLAAIDLRFNERLIVRPTKPLTTRPAGNKS